MGFTIINEAEERQKKMAADLIEARAELAEARTKIALLTAERDALAAQLADDKARAK